jgi:hypothetical protein
LQTAINAKAAEGTAMNNLISRPTGLVVALGFVLSFSAMPAWSALTTNCKKNIEMTNAAIAPYTTLTAPGVADQTLHAAWVVQEFIEVVKLGCDPNQSSDAKELAALESQKQQLIDVCRSVVSDESVCKPERLPAASGYRRPQLVLGSARAGNSVDAGSASGAGSSSSGARSSFTVQGTDAGNMVPSDTDRAKSIAQQSQQSAQAVQQRVEVARKGKRKTNNPAAQAHDCIVVDPPGKGLFGSFTNRCEYKVNFVTCNFKPRIKQGGFNWADEFDCEKKNGMGLHTPSAGVSVAAHNRGANMVYWFACRDPAVPVDANFELGHGIIARCY